MLIARSWGFMTATLEFSHGIANSSSYFTLIGPTKIQDLIQDWRLKEIEKIVNTVLIFMNYFKHAFDPSRANSYQDNFKALPEHRTP